jgi:BolA protein
MVEAEEIIGARAVEPAGRKWRAELAGFFAAGHRAPIRRTLDAAMPFARLVHHCGYIGPMSLTSTGPVEGEIIRRLEAALAPIRMELVNDSANHRGHVGDDGSGESHFSLTIESEAFAGLNRVQRQRAVYAALGELMTEKVHALRIRAVAPGD